jgi:hypothetical protein
MTPATRSMHAFVVEQLTILLDCGGRSRSHRHIGSEAPWQFSSGKLGRRDHGVFYDRPVPPSNVLLSVLRSVLRECKANSTIIKEEKIAAFPLFQSCQKPLSPVVMWAWPTEGSFDLDPGSQRTRCMYRLVLLCWLEAPSPNGISFFTRPLLYDCLFERDVHASPLYSDF